ncbi:hypothetical protein [Candidatus Liberibacter solanacearum]|uniref:hypothetical protein n=1 Tax=Candidatus Liberibacter solanacearum TaxID=556287 RepID=UPI000AC40BA0|nr:hypothetical protein [Candidatus Liberibacter solanacearum]
MDAILSRRSEDFGRVNSLSDVAALADETNYAKDIQKERDKAYQEGYAAAICDRELYWRSKNECLQQSHDNEIADLRELFESCTSEAISKAIRDSVKCLSNSLEYEVMRILESVLEIGISRKAAIEFSEIIIDFLKKGDCGHIKIQAPKNFHSLIEECLGEYSSMVCYEDSEKVEFSSKICGGVITTRLESWFSDVKKIEAGRFSNELSKR